MYVRNEPSDGNMPLLSVGEPTTTAFASVISVTMSVLSVAA